MAIVAGVDFGTLSVRVSIVDHRRGRLGSGVAEYPLCRTRQDPNHATQRHEDHMSALAAAARLALEAAGVSGEQVEALAIDTTGSSVIPVGEGLAPLDDYYLWCDHRAWREAGEITEAAHRFGLEAIHWCGDVYSSEWGFSKLLHWLRHNPDKRDRFVTALEHCDMVVAVLCGITDPEQVPRSICAMGHKWMWNASLGGLPSEEFLVLVDPLLAGVRAKITGRYETSDRIAGTLTAEWAARLGLREGIPIPVGAFDAHWDAIGAGVCLGDVVNVIGTSTCIIGLMGRAGSQDRPRSDGAGAEAPVAQFVPGVCGVVPGSVHPEYVGIEAGLSATGDIFDAIARRAGTTVAELSSGLERYRAGETGLLHLTWDNGDRTVLVNADLGGVTLGWNLTHTPQDDLFAAIEGTAFHTRVILERMEAYGAPVDRIINGGGIPQRNDTLNRVYANVLGKPILVPKDETTSLGSAIFACVAAGLFPTIEEAQHVLCPRYRVLEPDPAQTAVYDRLFPLFRDLYFAFGQKSSAPAGIGHVLPALRAVAEDVRREKRGRE
jgi:L-ribulokinase